MQEENAKKHCFYNGMVVLQKFGYIITRIPWKQKSNLDAYQILNSIYTLKFACSVIRSILTCYFTNVCRSKSSSELMFHVILCIRQKVNLLCLYVYVYVSIELKTINFR